MTTQKYSLGYYESSCTNPLLPVFMYMFYFCLFRFVSSDSKRFCALEFGLWTYNLIKECDVLSSGSVLGSNT